MKEIELYYEAVSTVFRFCTIGITSFFYVYFVKPFFERKEKAWMIGAFYAATMILLHKAPILFSNFAAYSIGVSAGFAAMCLLDRKNMVQKIFLAVTFFSLRWQMMRVRNCIYNQFVRFIRNLAHTKEASDAMFWFLMYCIQTFVDICVEILLMYAAVRLLLWAYRDKHAPMEGRELGILIMPSLFGAFAYEVLQFYEDVYETASGKNIVDLYASYSYDLRMLLFSGLSYLSIFMMVLLFQKFKEKQKEEKQREVFAKQMADLQNHIAEVERLYQDIRGMRHDMGNHVMTLEQLYRSGEHEAAGRYAEELQKELQESSSDVKSGNPVTDVILSAKKKEAKEAGIAFQCSFYYPKSEAVNAFDISIILNNALSNAMEAILQRKENEKEKEAWISVSSYRRQNVYMIEVKNSFYGELNIDRASGLPLTTKSAKEGAGHGFGLANIRAAAQKYYGDIEIKKEKKDGKEYCLLCVMLQIES